MDEKGYANAAPDENATYECQAEHAESKLKVKDVDAAERFPLVFEIPSCPHSVCSNKVYTTFYSYRIQKHLFLYTNSYLTCVIMTSLYRYDIILFDNEFPQSNQI